MNYKETYQEWITNPYFDEEVKAELRGIAEDEKEKEERFYTELEFGTAGLRGIIGAGTNRMNVYTVRKATQGLANYIKKVNASDKGVAIQGACHRNLLTKPLFALRQTALRHMCLNRFVQRRNCLMQSVN